MSAYLKKSIGAVVMTMALGHAAESFANNSTTNWLDTIHVTAYDNPYDVANSAFGWTIEDYNAWDAGLSEEYGGGGGGGGESPPPISSPCDVLRDRKPLNCPNPIPIPNGYAYGRGQYRSGSGIPQLIYFSENTNIDPLARDFARRALAHHTVDLTQPFVPVNTANERLLLSVQTACNLQHTADQSTNLLGLEISAQERDCLAMLGMLQAEANNHGFHGYFFEWMEREGIHLEDLGAGGVNIPETLLDWLSPSNSLRTRSEIVAADTQCARWWIDAQFNQCTL